MLPCNRIYRFLRTIQVERGATAVEYAIMVAFIAAIIVTSVTALGISTRGLFAPLIDVF
jgi:Flp pilus assembly pilin Flp